MLPQTPMHFVFVMDPVSTVIVDEDTSFALMLEAQARGHRVDHCLASDVGLRGRRVVARVRQSTMQLDAAEPIRLDQPEDIDLVDVDAVFIRKDPPFTDAYLWLTLVLDHLEGSTLVVNDPRGLREANEKLYAHHFPEIVPATIMTSHKDEILRFLSDIGGKAVIKPIDGHGGEGVFFDEGDKRILLVDGELLGVVGRVPSKGDLRSNVHVGGSVAPAEVSDSDRTIIETIAPRLLADRLFFVGLDVIGGKLIEVNVTSPTLLQQMSRLAGENLSAVVIDRLEEKARAYPS